MVRSEGFGPLPMHPLAFALMQELAGKSAVLFTAMAITLVAATIIETCPGALGLLWQNGGALVPPDIVMRVARTCADDQVDPLVWVRVNIANLEDKLFGRAYQALRERVETLCQPEEEA